MKQVVCKMRCHSNVSGEISVDEPHATITLSAVWEGSIDKQAASVNAIFGKHPPWGETTLGIKNRMVAGFFRPGRKYLVTFTEDPDQDPE